MRKLLLISLCVLSLTSFAQQKTGNLTVFTDDGDKFFLYLNGEKQNEIAQTNIRVEELPQPYYRAKIVFEDKSIPEISKNLPVADIDDKMMDVTYRVKKDKNGKTKIQQYSQTEVVPDFIIPAGAYVKRYGQPYPPTGGVHTTTTTTSSNTMNANVSVPGINMNISINDPNTQVYTTTTTTTRTSETTSQPQTVKGCSGFPMKQNDFAAAKKTIAESSFDDTKLSTAKSIISSNCMSADQVAEICKLLSFEESKLDFAKYAFRYTTDQKNYFKVNNVFSFSSSKEQLNDYIAEQ